IGRELLPCLEEQLERCIVARLAVSFVMRSGVALLEPVLKRALTRGATIKLLTSDYLDVTEPDALERLLALPGDIHIRAYREAGRSYHPKAYLFGYPDGRGRAFVGSSNLSASALRHGVEWNYEIHDTDAGWPIADMVAKFETLFGSRYSVPVDAAFV